MLEKFYKSLTEKAALKLLFLNVAVYFFVFFSWCYLKYISFAYDDFDFVVHDQVIWNIGQGSAYSSILGVNFLGNHIHLISFLVAPICKVFSHPLTLLFLQTLALSFTAFPLYKMAKAVLGYRLALVVAVVYLSYPSLGYTNLYEFHPTVFATFFLTWMFYYFFQKKMGLFVVFMILSMLCQENVPLVVAALGVYGLCTGRDKRFAAIALVCGIIYFIVCVKILLPYFNPDTIQFIMIYGPLGNSFSDILKTIVTDPLKVFHIVAQPAKLLYLRDIFISLSFLPLLSPSSLLLSLPLFAQHLLSTRPSEISLFYHYTAELIPPLFVAFIWGIARVRNTKFFKNKERFLAQIILVVALIVNMALVPHLGFIMRWKDLMPDYKDGQKAFLIEQIPKDASVVSTFEFLSHLSHRKGLYSFHHVYTGLFTLSSKPYQLPDDVQYALIDFNDFLTFRGFYGPRRYQKFIEFLRQGRWGVLDVKDEIVLFKKGVRDRYPLFAQVNGFLRPSNPVFLTVDGRFRLYGYDVGQQPDLIHFVFYWKSLHPTKKDVNIFIDFIDRNGTLMDRQYRPLCYRIWPTQAWEQNQRIQEHQYFFIPDTLKGRFDRVMIGFYDYQTGQALKTDSQDPLGRMEIKLTEK